MLKNTFPDLHYLLFLINKLCTKKKERRRRRRTRTNKQNIRNIKPKKKIKPYRQFTVCANAQK